ncbi:MAG: DUF1015 family protein [Lachnospiraceae bacterium]|nr:DUF1015 family protein [Lachnospiraceae bacterium]
MADIRPFPCVRPREDLAQAIAALPYDVYTRQEAEAEVKNSPLSFLRIDRPETNFPRTVGLYEDKTYEKAAELLTGMIEDGSFVTDEKPMYYLYELGKDGHTQTGIVACAAVQDYESGLIRRHENTESEKELDRIRHIETCQAQTGPIFLAYRANAELKEIMDMQKQNAPLYDFKGSDGVSHRVWAVTLGRDIRRIESIFEGMHSLYICDGHHRCAAAARVSERHRKETGAKLGEDTRDFFLSVLFPHDELVIMDYNRIVKDLNGLSEDRFLDRVRKKFSIEKIGRKHFRPQEKHHFGMYLSGCWYHLTAKNEVLIDNPVESLDVSILQNEILAPILNIEDLRTDKRIAYVGGAQGMNALERRVNSREYEAAFSLYPTDIEDMFAVADQGLLMPPKSTWFEPKLRSGLFIHKF